MANFIKGVSNLFASQNSVDEGMGESPRGGPPANKRAAAATEGMRVWMPVDDDDVWALATVSGKGFGGKVNVKRSRAPKGVKGEAQLTLEQFNALDLCTGDADAGIDDLVTLESVSTAAMLHTLRVRHDKQQIFTRIGPVLVVINPYEMVDCCQPKYMSGLSSDDVLTPHPHAIVAGAYRALKDPNNGSAQSILVSGESGAGKTETVKLAMKALAQISGSCGDTTTAALESGFLLEAFGNAATVHNHNSSRFGKWVAVRFDDHYKMATAEIKSYLLEEVRVVGQTAKERNFHVFYYLLAGATPEERTALQLKATVADYAYTKNGKPTAVGVDDLVEWKATNARLKDSFNLATDEISGLWRTISAVLSVGDLQFSVSATQPKEGEELCEVSGGAALDLAASLLGVDKSKLQTQLVSKDLVIKTKDKTGKSVEDRHNIKLSCGQCADARDALAKAVYREMFDLIVKRLNQTLGSEGHSDQFIGFLDIFGFENFELNGFNQLCINFTNEKLQEHFTDALITRRQQEWRDEGVKCDHIEFPDNQAQLKLLDSVFGMLDEECVVPQGNEAGYVDKMHARHEKNDFYNKPRLGKKGTWIAGKDPTKAQPELVKVSFLLKHYAGEVCYTAADWLEKNRGKLPPALATLLATSTQPMIAGLIGPLEQERTTTVGNAYRSSLRQLSSTMLATAQHYVRCIKPNEKQMKQSFVGSCVERQMRYTGVGAVVDIQRSGYPVSFLHLDFLGRYGVIGFDVPHLVKSSHVEAREACANLIRHAQLIEVQAARASGRGKVEVAGWLERLLVQVGATKVFMRDSLLRRLERARNKVLGRAGIQVQAHCRAIFARRAVTAARTHTARAAAIRVAVEEKDTDTATTLMKELRESWSGANLAPGGKGVLARFFTDLAALEEEVENLASHVELEWEGGDSYKGGWKDDNPHGKGKYVYADGNIYDGSWKEGLKHGEGAFTWAAGGKVFAGSWADDTMHGFGKYEFGDGTKYEGDYDMGVRNGKGKYTYKDGGYYEGEFKSAKKWGTGKYYDKDAQLVYEGQWQDKEHGQGVSYQHETVGNVPAGSIYDGEWAAGKREGKGSLKDAKGKVLFKGSWEANRPVQK